MKASTTRTTRETEIRAERAAEHDAETDGAAHADAPGMPWDRNRPARAAFDPFNSAAWLGRPAPVRFR